MWLSQGYRGHYPEGQRSKFHIITFPRKCIWREGGGFPFDSMKMRIADVEGEVTKDIFDQKENMLSGGMEDGAQIHDRRHS